jgi:radical SAM superfamily enzyme YgiQ (UPF0313 family)
MKILFLNPSYGKGFCKTARWFARSRAREQRHPDYICTAIGLLEKDGHICRFLDGAAKNISLEETKNVLKEFNPDAAIINATTPSIESDLAYARMCKEDTNGKVLTIMIGAHASSEPEDTFKKAGPFLDGVARREYDYTLRDFARSNGLLNIEGMSYFDNGKIIHNPDRPFIQDLDKLAFPAWRHINPRDYYSPSKRNPFLTLITGRGCEGRCIFCLFPQVMYGRDYRHRNPENVLGEIENDILLFPQLKEIMFEDDTFTLAKYFPRLEKICKGILDRKIKISWSCNARPDIQDFSILKLMKKSGCRMMCVGFESGDEKMLENLKKGITLDRMKNFAALCRKAGVSVHGCFVIGGPGETHDSIKRTVRFAAALPIDTAQFSGLSPYPGTEFYSWCRDNRFITARDWKEWVDEKGEQKTIVDYPDLSCSSMNEAIDKALYRFYLRPGYLFSQIMRPKSFDDINARLKGLFQFAGYCFKR